jgi:hypothetical protein
MPFMAARACTPIIALFSPACGKFTRADSPFSFRAGGIVGECGILLAIEEPEMVPDTMLCDLRPPPAGVPVDVLELELVPPA